MTKQEMCTSTPDTSVVVFEKSVQGLHLLTDINGYHSEVGVNGYQPGRRINSTSQIPPEHGLYTMAIQMDRAAITRQPGWSWVQSPVLAIALRLERAGDAGNGQKGRRSC